MLFDLILRMCDEYMTFFCIFKFIMLIMMVCIIVVEDLGNATESYIFFDKIVLIHYPQREGSIGCVATS
jgi:hypothetical protein